MARSVVLSTFLLGAGCGEDVLVGTLQLRSLTDAGADIAEAVEDDAGHPDQERAAQRARDKVKCKEQQREHCDDKDKAGH
jgi:hypothetical protein